MPKTKVQLKNTILHESFKLLNVKWRSSVQSPAVRAAIRHSSHAIYGFFSLHRTRRMIYFYKFAVGLWLTLAFTAAYAGDCEPSVKKFRTKHLSGTSICEIQARYKKASEELKLKGVQDPNSIGNVFARRFINEKSWNDYLTKFGDSEYSAWQIHQPAPLTWLNWAEAANLVSNAATRKLFLTGSTDQIMDWIQRLHKVEMTSLLPMERIGIFRTNVEEIIPLHFLDNAYSASDIAHLQRSTYVSALTGKKIMNFTLRHCENRVQTSIDYYFPADEQGNLKSCGDLTMAPPEEVLTEMKLWSQYVQNGIRQLSTHPEQIDLIEFAAIAQQWFVVVHPFVDGNGRTSRLMMDMIFNHFGLPAPLLADTSRDFFLSPQEWADEIGKGLSSAVTTIESCAKNLKQSGCKEVPSFAPLLNKDK